MLRGKIRKRKWKVNIRKDPVKHKKCKEDKKIRWAANKTKQIRKWQLLNQIVKIFLLQTTQLQIAVCHIRANKHYRSSAIADLHLPKKQTKKLKFSKGLRQNT